MSAKHEQPINLKLTDAEYRKLLCELYKGDWQKPQEGLLDKSFVTHNDTTSIQYNGDELKATLLHISNKSIEGKHTITISPINLCDKFAIEEHNQIINHFRNTYKNIMFDEV